MKYSRTVDLWIYCLLGKDRVLQADHSIFTESFRHNSVSQKPSTPYVHFSSEKHLYRCEEFCSGMEKQVNGNLIIFVAIRHFFWICTKPLAEDFTIVIYIYVCMCVYVYRLNKLTVCTRMIKFSLWRPNFERGNKL